jgi:hypothetical protein
MASYVVTADDREWFARCRRAWNLGALARRGLEAPRTPSPRRRLEQAVRDALAVHYFPGMWEWDRAIVRPLVLAAAERSGGTRRAAVVLDAFAAWARPVDTFTPLRVEADVDVRVPDPGQPERDLAAPDGAPVIYRDRLPLVVVDPEERTWVGLHRIVDSFAERDELALDERAVMACWAWEQTELATGVEGVVYTEVRLDPLAFRRTAVPHSRVEKAAAAFRLGRAVEEMLDPELPVEPTPAWAHCSVCAFRAPCIAMNCGYDAVPLLAPFRRRPADELEEGRLGGVSWGLGRGAAPPHFRTSSPR